MESDGVVGRVQKYVFTHGRKTDFMFDADGLTVFLAYILFAISL